MFSKNIRPMRAGTFGGHGIVAGCASAGAVELTRAELTALAELTR